MAITPAELVGTVAVALGIPYGTVKNYDRRLMEAGLRTKKGHGRGSALMGPEDAAILLAAIASCDEIGRAADCVRTLYELPFAGRSSDHPRNKFEDLPFLCNAIGRKDKEVNTFGKALVAVIQHLTEKADTRHYFGFEVSIAGGDPYAADLIITTPKKTRRIEFYRAGTIQSTFDAFLRIKRVIIGSALEIIANALAEREGAA
ncbi:hypothetical protein GGQ85_000248 [Nitrobacter vulgaris]|uniref:hypothetical protein n=1 Tax=Nitrobacter vulgaris TaxID=29421 RepID=UPI00285C7607|nr:hypothetical protein [Nitrobacter vulgaris]MDR6302572.1 hypothetical protein [Nitrobacter vulgaris]